MLRIVVPTESTPGEARVALSPEAAGRLVKAGFEVAVESGAGERAGFPDEQYAAAGAGIEAEPAALLGSGDIVLKVQRPHRREDGLDETATMRSGAVVVALLQALTDPDTVAALAAAGVTAFAMELVPRITRAQKMDALSSQSTVAGYKAALLAADTTGKFFPMLMTAAGTIPPARVLVLGAGVAGLQAIATCRRLGAVVEAFDTRPAVKEQVESLGASFVELSLETTDAEDSGGYAKELAADHLRREQELIGARAAKADIVITTALVPGRRAPLLITAEAVEAMRPGSVVIDLAGEAGGNCAGAVAGETVVQRGVKIVAPTNLPAQLPLHASQMYARNVEAVVVHLVQDGQVVIDMDDEITRGAVVTHGGQVVHEPTKAILDEVRV